MHDMYVSSSDVCSLFKVIYHPTYQVAVISRSSESQVQDIGVGEQEYICLDLIVIKMVIVF